MDFRMRVMREDRAVEKRGSQSSGASRRLGYLSILELADHSRIQKKKFRIESTYHAHQKHRVAQLNVYEPLVKEFQQSSDVKNDILKFCSNIVLAHITSAFGGQAAL
jgi:hypothetical protein